MPNNPVQIVLNDQAFLRAPEPGRGGPEKDFFAGQHSGFQKHRDGLAKAIDTIEKTIANWPHGPVAYVRVVMRIEALAKSYRPNRALFTSDRFPCVGAGSPGELFFRVPLAHISTLRTRILKAEDVTQLRQPAQGDPYHFVTRERCEVGAIETIEITPPGGKRRFAAAAAVQAFSDPRAAGGYVIELFERPPTEVIGDDVLGLSRSFETFIETLRHLGGGVYAALLPSPGGLQALELRLTAATAPALIEDRRAVRAESLPLPEAAREERTERHEEALLKIAAHPLVRRIRFPVLLEVSANAGGANGNGIFPTPTRRPDGVYPKVGVVDTGIAAPLGPWVLDRFDHLPIGQTDPTHGTFVAGLVIGAQAANGPAIGRDPDGCDVVDIPLFPTGNFLDWYGRGFEDFLEELENAIIEARDQHNVRVFNLSINVPAEVEPDEYSIYAARLDDIQDRQGVVIVNSVGNLKLANARPPWPEKPRRAIDMLANRQARDAIFMPSESVRAISVGALNPPGGSQLANAPTTYTRRGPGLRVGVKPDVAHYGGVGDVNNTNATALASCGPTGDLVERQGTSYAAPLVAKTLATLDVLTQQQLAPRTLRAFAVHGAEMPAPLAARGMRDIGRQFAGFGQPCAASDMLETDDFGITLVFESRLTAGERRPAILRFPFLWPAALTEASGACRGKVRMTLVYDAPINQAFGAEFVRVNLDAHLRQRQEGTRQDGSPSWRSKIAQVYLPRPAGLTPPERALIDYGLKWWPTKRYEDDFGDDGIGESAEWRLEIESLVRAEASFPLEGVPFSVVLTISDPARRAPVFQQLRRELLNRNVQLNDIRLAARVRPRR